MIIVLMGYMGSGKSTVGKALASLLKHDFIDLDNYISQKENLAVTELFAKKGEIYFRKKESQYLNEVISDRDNIVLALGGGTPCYGNNLSVLLDNKKVKTFYLKLSINSLKNRLKTEKDNRPLIAHLDSDEEMIEFLGKHLFERSQYYSQAHYIINADEKSKKEVLEDILMRLI